MDALKEAEDLHNTYIGSEHILLSILKNDTLGYAQLLNAYGMYYGDIKNELFLFNEMDSLGKQLHGYSPVVEEILLWCDDSASMLLYMLKEKDCLASVLLRQYKIELENFYH